MRGECSTNGGSNPDTIDVDLNLAVTDTEGWLKRGIEACLDSASQIVQSLSRPRRIYLRIDP